mgnify:CR=1 FL=1|jgi:hypothetical protein
MIIKVIHIKILNSQNKKLIGLLDTKNLDLGRDVK